MGKVATSPLPSRGSPPLQSGGGNQKWPTCGQSGYVTPAVSGIPTASERGGEIRSGPLVGKVAMSPLPSQGSPPLQSGGRNQKWPTCGQSGYVTLAVSRIPTASERGGKQKWPTCGQSGYVTPAVSEIPTASERGGESEVAHLWAKWLCHPCRLGDPHRFRAGGGKSEVAHLWAKWLCHPCRLKDPHRCRAGGEIRSGPLVGKVATRTLPSRGSPPLQSGGGNQKWPTCGQSGYVTLAISGIPTASKRGGKSEVAHLWAKWLRHPCRLGDPHRFRAGGGKSEVAHLWAKWLCHPCRLKDPHRCRAGGEIRSGPLVGKVATRTLPSRGSPPLQSGGGNQKWPTCGQSGYVTPAVSGIPTASERGGKSEVAHLWAKWLRHPCRLGDPHRFRAGGEIRSGPLVGKVAMSPLPSQGSPPLQSGGGNQKWPTCGQSGYVTLAVSGIPIAVERGGKSEVAHLWAKWLRHPCRLGDPHRFRAGGEIRSGPLVGKVATSPLPSRGSPPLQSGGGDQKWPTCGQSGSVTPAVSRIPTASERGGEIRSGPLVGKVATSPLPSRGSPPLQSGGGNQKWPTCGQSGYVTPAVSGIPTASERGGEIRSGPLVGKVATSPLPSRGSPLLQSGGGNQKWPTCGQSGYVTLAISGIPTASERGGESEVAHLWAKWLRHPCRLGDPHRFRAGGGNQKWPTCGQSGYVTLAVSGIPTAVERGGKSEVAHLWAKWLRHPCRVGDPHRFRAGGGIRSGPLVGKVAMSPLPSQGSPPLQSGGGNQKWPTCGQSGYVTLAVSRIPTASERGGKSEVAHLWAKWLRHPCRLGDPHRFKAGGEIRSGPLVGKVATSPLPSRGSPTLQSEGEIGSGPLVGKVATSPLPSRGSPPLQSGGVNQKWPTCGQSGYVTPAISRIPTASERGGGIRSGPLVGKVAMSPPPSQGSPPLQSGGGEIRSGPLVGKVATSPLRYRGSPALQSGGGNQKWPTCERSGYVTLAVSGIPTASQRGGKSEVAHLWAKWLYHPRRLKDPHRFRAGGGKSEVAHLWAKWLPHPCGIGDPQRFKAGGKIRSGPLVGKVATSPLPSRGSPPLQSGGGNQKWPTCGQSGYVTLAVSGIPTASKRGGK